MSSINAQNTISSTIEEAKWTVIKYTGEKADNFRVDISDRKSKVTEICYVIKKGVDSKRLPNTIERKDETNISKQTITKEKRDSEDMYCFNPTSTEDYIKIGDSTIVIEYQNISRVNYVSDWFNLNATLFIDLSGDWNNTINNIFVFDNPQSKKFGANVSNYNSTQHFKYLIEVDREIIHLGNNKYQLQQDWQNNGLIKSREVHDPDFSDICDDKYDNGTLVFSPNCTFSDIYQENGLWKLEVEFYAEYNQTLDIIPIDPTITIVGDSNYDSIDTNITQENGFAHLNISSEAPYDSLSLYFPMDVNTTFPVDYSEIGNDVSSLGNPLSQFYNDSGQGVYRNFWTFQPTAATGAEFVVPYNESLDFEDKSFALSAWIKASTTNTGWLFLYDTSSFDIFFNIQSDSSLRCGVNDLSNDRVNTNANLIDNEWHLITCVFDAPNTNLTIYFDGVPNASVDTGNSGSTMGTPDWFIGGAGSENSDFEGDIDEIMMFNNSLTASQVLDIFNNQSSRFSNSGTMTFENLHKPEDVFNSSETQFTAFDDSSLNDVPPPSNTLPPDTATELSSGEYDDIAVSDDNRYSRSIADNNEAYVYFNVSLPETTHNITMINWTFEGHYNGDGSGSGSIGFYMWNYSSLAWYNCTNAIDDPSDVTVSCIETGENNINDFRNSEGDFIFMAYGEDIDDIGSISPNIRVDYVSFTATNNSFNKVNISLENYQNLLGSNISVDINGTPINLTIDGNLTNITLPNVENPLFNLTFNYQAGHNSFYTPLIIGNITLEFYNVTEVSEPPTDSCTPPASGDWTVDCTDNCVLNSAATIDGNIYFRGNGLILVRDNYSLTSGNHWSVGGQCEVAIRGGSIG